MIVYFIVILLTWCFVRVGKRCNMIISWVTQMVNTQIVRSIVYKENTRELWENLYERFSKGNILGF